MSGKKMLLKKKFFQDYIGTPIVFWLIINIPVALWFQSFGIFYIVYALITMVFCFAFSIVGIKLKIWPFTDDFMRDD